MSGTGELRPRDLAGCWSSAGGAGGFEAFPQGSFAPQARAGSDPDSVPTGVPGFGAVDPSGNRGSLPARISAQGRRFGFRSMRANCSGAVGFEQDRDTKACPNQCPNGEDVLRPYESAPVGDPPRAHYSRESSRCRVSPGTTGRPAISASGAPLPGRMTRSDRRGRPARPFVAVVVAIAERRAGVQGCHAFLPLPPSTQDCRQFWMCCLR